MGWKYGTDGGGGRSLLIAAAAAVVASEFNVFLLFYNDLKLEDTST